MSATALALVSTPRPAASASSAVSPPARRRPRVGMLGESNPFAWVFHDADVEVVCRWAAGSGHALRRRADELNALDVDVIVAAGVRAARAAIATSPAIPVVFVVHEEVGGDLGGRATGLVVASDAEICSRRLAVLRQARSRLARVGVLHNPDNALHAAALEETGRLADRVGLAVEVASADRADRLDGALAALAMAGAEGLIVLPDALFAIHAARVVATASALHLPGLYPAPSFARAGGLMALHGDTAEVVGRLRATVRRILAGTRVEAMPVQRLDGLALTVNAGAAAALGLALPRALWRAADAVITSASAS